MSTGTALATTERRSVIREMAHKYGMEPDTFEATVRATCMPQGNNVQPMTREEFAAGIMVAEKYTLNPILREIYFYPRKGGGIVPVVSIDGWLSLINRRKELDGIEFDELHDEKGKLVSITCRIYRTDRKHPTIVTEHLSECWRDTIPWKMPHRMLRHKALIQCARYAFGFAGIHDEDEAERIVEAVAVQQITGPSAPPPPPAVESRPQEPAPPENTNAGPAAPPAEVVEDAEIVETGEAAPDPAIVAVDIGRENAQHPPLAQEEPFDPEAWLAEVQDRFHEARTPADVDSVHEVFGDDANELGMTERQRYQDMHEAAVLRTAAQGKPEQAEVTGEPGPAPDEAQDAAEDDEDDIPSAEQPAAQTVPDPGEAYYRRITAAVADSIRTYDSIAGLWKATKPERDELIANGHLSRERMKEMQASIKARYAKEFGDPAAQAQPAAPAGPGPSAPPAEEDEVTAYDRSFRARVEACKTIEEIGNLSAGTLAERAKFAGNPLQAEWKALVADRRKQITGVA